MDAAGSSQVLTGLLCALAHAEGDSDLNLHGVVSRPYVQMTLEVLEDMGIDMEVLEEDEDARTLLLRIPGNQRPKAMDMAIDGDWSAAAFLLGLGALCAPSPECGRPAQHLHPSGRRPSRAPCCLAVAAWQAPTKAFRSWRASPNPSPSTSPIAPTSSLRLAALGCLWQKAKHAQGPASA